MTDIEEIQFSLDKLDLWIQSQNFRGYDPYDIKGTAQYIKWVNAPNLRNRLLRKLVEQSDIFFPTFLRHVCNVQPEYNAKALGLLLESYSKLYIATRKAHYIEIASSIYEQLLKLQSPDFSLPCWGYPFDWQTVIFIKRNTPSSVVTVTVGSGLYWYYIATHDSKILEICVKICRFICENLNRTIKNNLICFSYTPIDDFMVHNSNLMCAEFLLRIGYLIANSEFTNIGLSAAEFSRSRINADGSLFYWADEHNKYAQNHTDAYHSGFEIRSFHDIYIHSHEPIFLKATENYILFYIQKFLYSNMLPQLLPNSQYPVDIHACAEAIYCMEHCSIIFPNTAITARNTALSVIKNLQMPYGWFIYRIINTPLGLKNVRIPYMRWGQSWMMRALSEVIYNEARKCIY